ncbi:Pyrophosphatase PpaX [Candidatus Lokiarchaeum ossiferum]|uniref:Pyrophosphatase PpaX n=1 Tax=Candidatus Lokiarchaeum ossiferum TaxID=2951803 RepID=A0ABY6HNE7_9ARCH|nr:Pyrophosphatase PpaX [Candidatus Lokiarchaeum sp. B-35]
MEGITCVLFDLDNTLIEIPNTWIYFDTLIQDVMEQIFNLPIPPKEQRDTLWRSGKEYIKILQSWGVKDPDEFWYHFDQFDAKKRRVLIQQQKLFLYEDTLPTLNRLNKIPELKIGIVTNTPTFLAIEELEAYNLTHFFNEIIGLGEDQSICKPEPTGINQILRRMDKNHKNTLFIGDSLVDIQAGINAHVTPILIDRHRRKSKGLKGIHPSKYLYCNSLQEIFNLVQF